MPSPLLVFQKFSDIPHITESKARYLYDLIKREKPENCLELGFSHGKSSAVIAQALEENCKGKLFTLDLPSALGHDKNIHYVLNNLGLAHRVEVRTDSEGFHWTLMDMLSDPHCPKYDFVFLDGAHTWVGTGFAFLLVERFLRPGAWLVFDDVFWTIKGHQDRRTAKGRAASSVYANTTDRERTTQQVRKVFDLLVDDALYEKKEIMRDLRFAVARKRLEARTDRA